MKPALAIWMPAGVGGGFHAQGLPFIHQLVSDLAGSYTIDVYSMHPARTDFLSPGFRIISAPRWMKVHAFRWMWLVGRFFGTQRRYNTLYAFWGYPAGLICVFLSKLLGKKSVVHLLGADSVCIPSVGFGFATNGLRRYLLQWTYRNAGELITLSRFQADRLPEIGIQRRPTVIPFGVDTQLFKPPSVRTPRTTVHIIHVGNLTLVKDQFTLVRAFRRIRTVRDAKLRILGVDHLAGAIQALCRELGVEHDVEFLPVQPHSQMPVQYVWADVLLHTSVFESQCVSAVEAAACGVPVAGTGVGILADWGDEVAVVTPVGDAEALAVAVLHMLDNPERMLARRSAALQWAREHDRSWSARQVADILKGVS
jgi:glycosyltransferase involved in cell wall biosynthesis